MKPAILGAILSACAFCQAAETLPKFEAADVHVSPKPASTNGPMGQFVRTSPARNGRYEIKTATMVDLIRIAYGYQPDKILGGPSWLEMDRFDITAKIPPDSTADTQKQMLQSLLQERFKLAGHKEDKPLPTYALVAGKKLLLKEAAGSEQTGCRPKTVTGNGPGPAGGVVLFMSSGASGEPTRISIGPGGQVEYNCRNISMDAFVANLPSMFGANVGRNPLLNETGIQGNFSFDLTYSMGLIGPMMDEGSHISIFTAVEKELGLKLEERHVPTPVYVVDSVERTPAPNPSGTSEILPQIAPPAEFEVASVKPTDPSAGRGGRYQMQPGGRLVAEGMNLRFLVQRAFNVFNNEAVVNLPNFADSERFDVMAKAPVVDGVPLGNMDMELTAPMMLSLLKERFGLKYHTEDRPVTAYSLVAPKPKLKKADPNTRTTCKNDSAPPPAPSGTRLMSCTNMTLDEFVERLTGNGLDSPWPVANSTGLEGRWDITLSWSQRAMMAARMAAAGGGRGGAPVGEGVPAAAVPTASDPVEGYTMTEALEKQLGLKLEKRKRTLPVIVIDHIEQKPTEN
jgi:uncharacterized protein (TIGR03435 family)